MHIYPQNKNTVTLSTQRILHILQHERSKRARRKVAPPLSTLGTQKHACRAPLYVQRPVFTLYVTRVLICQHNGIGDPRVPRKKQKKKSPRHTHRPWLRDGTKQHNQQQTTAHVQCLLPPNNWNSNNWPDQHSPVAHAATHLTSQHSQMKARQGTQE